MMIPTYQLRWNKNPDNSTRLEQHWKGTRKSTGEDYFEWRAIDVVHEGFRFGEAASKEVRPVRDFIIGTCFVCVLAALLIAGLAWLYPAQ